MSTQAGISDARQIEVSQSPAETAIVTVAACSGEVAQDEIAQELSGAALGARMLVIDVSFLPADATPWLGSAAPGTDGCSLRPGNAPNLVQVRSDRAGHFLASNIGLVLRSNGVRTVVMSGCAPPEFAATLRHTLALQGYVVLAPASLRDAKQLSAGWRDGRKNRHNWEPESKAADLLTTLAQRIDPRHAALVLIDVQNDFCDTRGAVGRSGEPVEMIRSAVARIKDLLAAARAADVTVIHVRAEYGELYRGIGSPYRFPSSNAMEPAVWTASAADLSAGQSFAANEVEVCLPGSWGQQFVEGIVPRSDEPVVTKHRFSAFVDTGLELMLRARGIKTVILAGVTTNCCVELTAREVAMRDFYLVVAEDCVAVKDRLRSLHDASLELMRLYFGQVRPAADLIHSWTNAGRAEILLLQDSAVMSGAAVGHLDGALRVPQRAGGSRRLSIRTSASSLLIAPAILIVCFCLLVPLSYVVMLSFNPPVSGEVELTSELTLANYGRLFLQWFYTGILLRTIWISAITTALCAVFGMVLALAIWQAPPRRRGLLVIIVISPLLVSIVTRTYGWMVVLGDNGILNALLRGIGLIDEPLHIMFTQGAVVVGLVHVFLPLMVLSILAAMDKIDPALAQAAQTLGASSFVTFWQITFPLLIPGLTAGVTIVFSLAMSSYVTPALMGGRNSGMLTNLIYQQFVVTYNWHFGAALVVVLLATSLVALGLVLLESGRRTRAWLIKP